MLQIYYFFPIEERMDFLYNKRKEVKKNGGPFSYFGTEAQSPQHSHLYPTRGASTVKLCDTSVEATALRTKFKAVRIEEDVSRAPQCFWIVD